VILNNLNFLFVSLLPRLLKSSSFPIKKNLRTEFLKIIKTLVLIILISYIFQTQITKLNNAIENLNTQIKITKEILESTSLNISDKIENLTFLTNTTKEKVEFALASLNTSDLTNRIDNLEELTSIYKIFLKLNILIIIPQNI
jgi:uncharacterized membrane protein YraQ (UPF0718 family)